MRYFKNRTEAGKLLAREMTNYVGEHCAVLALSEGGIVVGAEIAKEIHSSLFLLTIEDIILPRELEALASMSSGGTFTFNHNLSHADLEEITVDARPVIDQMRMDTFKKLNRMVSHDGEINKNYLKRHTIIVASDGIQSGLSIDVAEDFLRPIVTKSIVVATPLCNSEAIDRVKQLSDAFYTLNVIESGFPLGHYYEDNTLPSHDEVIDIMKNISLKW